MERVTWGTEIAHGEGHVGCAVLAKRMLLCAVMYWHSVCCYAAVRYWHSVCCYALWWTGIAYAAMRLCGTETVYGQGHVRYWDSVRRGSRG
eukprot:3717549-Rhodomonas_salina.1